METVCASVLEVLLHGNIHTRSARILANRINGSIMNAIMGTGMWADGFSLLQTHLRPCTGQHRGALILPTLPETFLIFHLFSLKKLRRTSTLLSACFVAALRPLVSHANQNTDVRQRHPPVPAAEIRQRHGDGLSLQTYAARGRLAGRLGTVGTRPPPCCVLAEGTRW